MSDLRTWSLETEGDELTWGGCRLSDLARKYGTPLFVVNSPVLEQSARSIQEAFRSQGCDVDVFFSYKTNPIPETLRRLAGLGIGAEVISELELQLARRLGLAGARIIVNGSNKPDSLLRLAAETGAAIITVHGVRELLALERISTESGVKTNVGLRINPGLRSRFFNFTTSTGSKSSPIGFAAAGEEWKRALRILRDSAALRFRGLHFHIGSGIRTAAPYREALKNTATFLDDVLEHNLVPDVLDIGGGFNISTLKEINLWEAVRLFAWNEPQTPPRGRPHTEVIGEVAAACGEFLELYFRRGRRLPVPRIFVEPGRAISGSSQLLLLSVKSVVERKPGKVAAICDGGAMSLSQLLLSEYHSLFVANKAASHPAKKYNIYGSLPTPLDLVSAGRVLPALSPGDFLAVMDTGAYFTSLGNNFVGPRPAIVMVEGGKEELIRRRETFEDLFSRDVIWKGESKA